MAISSLNNSEDIFGTRLSDIVEDNIKYLIYQGKQESRIELELENDKITLDLLYSEKDYPSKIADFFLNFIENIQITDAPEYGSDFLPRFENNLNRLRRDLWVLKTRSKKEESKEELNKLLEGMSKTLESANKEFRNELIKSEKLFLVSELNNNLIAVHLKTSIFNGEIPVSAMEEIPDIQKIPLLFSSPKINKDISEIYNKLVSMKKLGEVFDILKRRIPYFEDIREVDGELNVLLENLKKPLPLSFMGDGFEALLKLSFMAPLIKDGIILFEEPEVSMHPGYLDVLSEEILSSSEHCQFFVSTHSLELIEYLLKKADKRGKMDSINILKLRRLEGGYIDREICTAIEAKEEMETIKTDLRGF